MVNEAAELPCITVICLNEDDDTTLSDFSPALVSDPSATLMATSWSGAGDGFDCEWHLTCDQDLWEQVSVVDWDAETSLVQIWYKPGTNLLQMFVYQGSCFPAQSLPKLLEVVSGLPMENSHYLPCIGNTQEFMNSLALTDVPQAIPVLTHVGDHMKMSFSFWSKNYMTGRGGRLPSAHSYGHIIPWSRWD